MKKGFTLIELLAVIVILAIIAVIAVPIVINIIDDSKRNASLRSAEFYLDAVEMSVANSTLKNTKITDGIYNIKNGNICLNDTCTETLEVEVNGEVPKIGNIYLSKGQIQDLSFNIDNKIIGKNNEGKISYLNKLTDICELKNAKEENKINAGDEYECRVTAGIKQTFYVLTTPGENDTNVNLIMNANINSKEEAVTLEVEDKGSVHWQVSGKNTDGPITAMEFLYNATKNWTNIPGINFSYYDRESQGGTTGYISFISTNGIAKITSGTTPSVVTTIGTIEEPLRARMPIYSLTDSTKKELAKKTDENEYLYSNLNFNFENSSLTIPPSGYLTLSSYPGTDKNTDTQSIVLSINALVPGLVDGVSKVGVRPVISLKI